jgi:two-component system cell cycle sensor histidine kinase/response regulator CckA
MPESQSQPLPSRSGQQGPFLPQLLSRIRAAIPEGRSLPEDVWQRRHRGFLLLLWLHALGLPVFALVKGLGLDVILVSAALPACAALVGGVIKGRRKVQASIVSLGFLTSSAMLVYISGGYIEMHFHYFVMVTLLALYQDWTPFLLAIGYVLFQHGVGGLLMPHTVYNHPDAWLHPWKWALIHATFLSAACVGSLVAWRVNERHHARTQLLLDSMAEGLYGLDLNGRIVFANSAAAKLTGYTVDELLHHSAHELLHHSKADRTPYPLDTCPIHKGLGGGERYFVGDEVFWRKDGTSFSVECRCNPIRDRGELAGITVTFFDTTDRKRLEAQLLQSQKMEGLGRLAGGIAHDFNNLLTVISGYSDLLRKTLPPDAKEQKDVKQIKQAAGRAADMTKQLLAFSRQQVLQPRVLDLNTVVAQIDQLLRRLIGEDIRFRTILGASVARIKADKGQLDQVILNMAVNARDAMPDGGQLTIETQNVMVNKAQADRHPGIATGHYVMLAVNDTGTGMDQTTRSHIFEPFFTTKEQGKGTGLGLATAYGIIQQSGGFVDVYSEVGHGTTFKIYLPQVDEAASPVTESETIQDLVTGTEVILLVEDEEMVRELALRVLQDLGYKVLEAGSGEGALHLAEVHRGPIHLLVTDIVMPGMSGDQLAERLVRARPDTKVLYVSGYTSDTVVRRWTQEGKTAFLQKPYDSTSLTKKVREVLDAPANQSN